MGLFSSNKKSNTNTKGKNKKDNPLNVPKTVQDTIPYLGVYENGIIQVSEENFSKVYKIPDMNFLIEDTEKQKEIFGNFMVHLARMYIFSR